jgi:uroporphyrinogen-III decarboxylase
MDPNARKLRDTYARLPNAPLFQREFGYYCLERWAEQGMPLDVPLDELFGYDPPGHYALDRLGWCEAAFDPPFEEKVVEDRGDYEVVQDIAGRRVLCFKGRRIGFMPEYLDHPVKNAATWRENCRWRMDPLTSSRYADLEARMADAVQTAGRGIMIQQNLIGGYMYLRSLIGPEELLMMLYDAPDLIHDCMQTWFELADAVIARHQQYVTLDELYLAEDICYNRGPLISPAMMREFLLPYYRRLIQNIQARQIDRTRHLYIQIDTDGWAVPVIPVYQEIGMDVMSPFEVAAGCDVVAVGTQVPDLTLFGGIDKRVLARGREAIDRMVDRILPVMRRRGGYIPTCDHGVPEEVPYEDYLHFRRRCLEFAR